MRPHPLSFGHLLLHFQSKIEGERNFDIGLTLRNSKSAQLKRTASYAHPAYKFLHRLLSVCLVL